MARQRRQNKNQYKRQRTGTGAFFDYTLVTGGDFYGVKVGNSIDDFLNFDQNTSSTPDVIITGNTAVLDFSSSLAKKDLNYIKVITDTIVSGNTFEITKGDYYDPNTEQYADISGTYTYEGIFRDTVIKATFDALTNIPTGTVRYSSEYFADVPQINLLGTASTGREQFTLKNYLGTESNPSFTSIGTRVNDFITIADSTSNNKKFRVDDFYLDPNGTEVLILGATSAVEEDRIGVTSEIKLYREQGDRDSTTREHVRIETLKITVGVENNEDYYFMINGIRSPKLILRRGITYLIDQTDPSNYKGPNNTRLPFRLSRMRDGIFNTDNVARTNESIFILDGVAFPRTEANMFIFEPRFVRHSTIYYFSEARSGMGGELMLEGAYSIYDRRIAGPASVPPQYTVLAQPNDIELIAANTVSARFRETDQFGTIDGTVGPGSTRVNRETSGY